MSIGLGVVLPNGVILASDTRQRNAFGPASYEDVPGKLERLTDEIWAIQIGVTVATEMALSKVREGLRPNLDSTEISKLVRNATCSAWEEFKRALGLTEESELAAILLVGGLAKDSPFLCGSYQTCYVREGRREGVPRFVVLNPFNFVMFGGKATSTHYSTLENGLKTIKRLPGDPVPSVLELIRTVMEEAAGSDPGVGGEIEYVVIRRDSIPEHGSLGVIKNAEPVNPR